MKPIIHVYVLCWNEEKMIPFFINHYLKFVDHIYVYDNGSDDNSIELLSEFENVTIRRYDSNNQIRDDYYLTIKNHEWKESIGIADIVIVCDMDEFVYSDNILQDMVDFYQSESTIVKPIGYNMISEIFDFNSENKNITELVKTGVYDAYFNKLCIFKPDQINEINYGHGCHLATPVGNVNYYKKNIKLLHYKYLTLEFILNRMEQYKIRLSDFNKKYRLGFQYEHDNQEHIDYFITLLNQARDII